VRPVVLQKQDENETVVKSGVTAGERVVTTGFARLTDKSKVSVSSGGDRPAPAAAPRQRNGQQRPAGAGGARPSAPQ
jgi:multidrug efflux system membrane fusion protein